MSIAIHWSSILLGRHLAMGGVPFLLTLMRIVWWMMFDKHPTSPVVVGRLQATVARFGHLSLYVIIVLIIANGLRLVLVADALPLMVAGELLPDFSPDGITLHGLVSRILILLVCLHIGAALYHQFIRRDNLVVRRLSRR